MNVPINLRDKARGGAACCSQMFQNRSTSGRGAIVGRVAVAFVGIVVIIVAVLAAVVIVRLVAIVGAVAILV